MTAAATVTPQRWLEERIRTDIYDAEVHQFVMGPHSVTDPGFVGDVDRTIKEIESVLARMSTVDESRNMAVLVRLVAAWLEGLNSDEVAELLGFSTRNLTKVLHGEAPVQGSRAKRVVQVAELVRQLSEVIRPEAIGRWFRTEVPDLGSTPFEAVHRRRIEAVLDVVRSYSSPSYA